MSEETVDYKQLYEEERRKLADAQYKIQVLAQKIAVYELGDLEKQGYFVFKAYVKQQIDVVKDFRLHEEITKNPKDDKFYDRVKAIGEGLKSMISDMNDLKATLKISPEEERQSTKTNSFTSPESIANVLGNTAGQRPQRTGA